MAKKKCKSIIYLPQIEKDETMAKSWTANSSEIKSTFQITVLSFDYLDIPDFLTKISRIFEISPYFFCLFLHYLTGNSLYPLRSIQKFSFTLFSTFNRSNSSLLSLELSLTLHDFSQCTFLSTLFLPFCSYNYIPS